jgi:hypothetical protein
MGFFNKKNTAAPADTTTATGTHREKSSGIFAHKNDHGGARVWNSRPTFGQWIKATALDIVTMAALGAVGLGVYFADPAPSRSFPGKFQSLQCVSTLGLTSTQLSSVMERLSTLSSPTPCATRSSLSGLLLLWRSSFPSLSSSSARSGFVHSGMLTTQPLVCCTP